MDNHGKYSPIERQRLLEGGSGGSVGSGSNGGGGGHPPSVSEFVSRVTTPTTMTTLAHYHDRYGLPSAMPGSNFAIMSSLLSGTHSLKPRTTLLPDIQHYWSAQADTFPRYLMTGGLYPSYSPLLTGTAESLSLLGTGVACVSGAATTGVGPSQPHHMAHYQQLLEMQKEAYLASMSAAAAANHHTALYGISNTAMSPFLDPTAVSSHGSTSLSMVKQEPKEQTCVDRTAKPNESGAVSFKVDADFHKGSRDASSMSTSTGNSPNVPMKDLKLSPSSSLEVSGKLDRKGANGNASRAGSYNVDNVKKSWTDICDSSSVQTVHTGSRQNRHTEYATSSVQSSRSLRGVNPVQLSCSKKSTSQSFKSSPSLQTSANSNTSMSSSSPLLSESPVVSVPTQAPSPIALATIQHDGVVLSALASPSSAAASSISTKSVVLKQHPDKLIHTSIGNHVTVDTVRSTSETSTSNVLSDQLINKAPNCDRNPLNKHSNRDRCRDVKNGTVSSHHVADTCNHVNNSKLLIDNNSEIVVDSTECESTSTNVVSTDLAKLEHDRAINETIEKVASTVDSDMDSDQDDESTSQSCFEIGRSNITLQCVTPPRIESTCPPLTLPAGTSTGTRTVYAKTQPVLSVAVSGNNIPVGIAVAQIRPHHNQSPKDSQTTVGLTRDNRNIHTSTSTKTKTVATSSLTAPATALAPSLVVTGPAVNQSPWLQQMPFPLHQTMNSSGTTFDPSFPITAPSGFKFAQDSLTGQFFLIPNGDFVKQGGVWSSSPNFSQPTDTGSTHFQTTLNLATVTVNGTEKREGRRAIEENSDMGKSAANTPGKIILVSQNISKERPGLAIDDGKYHVVSQPLLGNSKGTSSQGLITATTAATVLVNPVTSVSSISPSSLVKVEQSTVESRGCSPIVFEDISSPLSLLSTVSCLSYERPRTCTVAVQTCDNLMRSSYQRKLLLHDQAVQTVTPDFQAFNPLSVQCPDLDSLDHLTHSLQRKAHSERTLYNPFTDPQILQAADGLELLSTLAEKRPKCSSLDDPKRIFPSPSDSFKSDSASIVAMEDTLSPGDTEFKSGQCTPRREMLRDLSPKWSLPKKDPHALSLFADFKTPSEIEIPEDSEVRVKLAEVQRQYKEKQKGLAKLQSKKVEDKKLSKRGPGRPPKKKSSGKKSDDESSSSSSKTKDNHQPQKKKRPAEELVDRVFRKLPPVIKASKASRSIHYVKSKTGPFFRRKSASSSVKRNKDLFGFDESNWPSFSERKHQEKVRQTGSTAGKTSSRHRSSSSHSEDSKHSQDAGNIFSNLENYGTDHVERIRESQDYVERIHGSQDYVETRGRPLKRHSPKHIKSLSVALDTVAIKKAVAFQPAPLSLHSFTWSQKTRDSIGSETWIKTCPTSSHQDSGLVLLAKFALNASSAPMSTMAASTLITAPMSTLAASTLITAPMSTMAASTLITTPASDNYISTSAVNSFGGRTFSTNSINIGGSGMSSSCNTIYNTNIRSQTPRMTFGSNSSFIPSVSSCNMISFSNPNLLASTPINSSITASTPTSIFSPLTSSTSTMLSLTVSPVTSRTASTSASMSLTVSPPTPRTASTSATLSLTVSPAISAAASTSASMSLTVSPPTPTTASTSTMLPMTVSPAISVAASTSITVPSQVCPSPDISHMIVDDSSNGFNSGTTSYYEPANSNAINSTENCSDTINSLANSSMTDARSASPTKRKLDEDSDTDASDTSLNKKRKPGRPRKMNPEKSSCGTETIWAKKSSNIGMLQVAETSCNQSQDDEDDDGKKVDQSVMKPLFLDEEWTRRRSERIFLSESSPQPSPALSPAPRGEPVWKLSHFMPKSKKTSEVSCKSAKEGDKDRDNKDLSRDQSPTLNLDPNKPLPFSSVTSSSSVAVKTEGKESISWTCSTATVEISTLKLEDIQKLVKVEDPTPTLSLPPLSDKVKTNSKSEVPEKKKTAVKKQVQKSEELPTRPSPPTLEMKERRAEENSKIKLQKAKSLHDLTQRVKKKFSKAGMKKQDDYQLKMSSKMGQKKRRISTDSSDTDNIPLVSYKVNPPTPEPRACRLQQSDLREGLKVLYLIDGLFHEGTVKALQPPDIYGVLTAGQRGNRPHILCLEEILKWAVLDMKPGSLRYLTEGTRICAFWSQQFSCLYPGTVAKSSPISNGKKVVISVEFDDGDNGRIELDHIRLLPSDFPIVEYEPDPLETLPKRKQRTISDASDRRKSIDTSVSKSSKHSKDKEEEVDEDDNDDKSNEDVDSDSSHKTGKVVRRELWKWDGKSTKRPGLKGKAKKVFYKAISRGKETVKVGDSAIFVSKERVNCPYIGRIESLWEGWNGQMMVRVQWYYHPEETESNKKLADPRNALFESQHEDENDIQTIAHKCQVLSFAQYKKRFGGVTKKGQHLKHNVFFVAGKYDPAAKDITFHPGVS